MAKPLNNMNAPKKGMNRDIDLSEQQPNEYSIAINANIESADGETFILSNEQSNILATRFKGGFKFLGGKNDINSNNTYIFLLNPTTGVGEFGVIQNTQNTNDLEDLLVDCGDCSEIRELSTPLEDQEQIELQTYETLLSDQCHIDDNTPEKGFQFDINKPIKKISIKNEKCGKTLYFTDDLNPPRHIILDNLSLYQTEGDIICGVDNTTPTCLNNERLRIFKLFDIPNIVPVSIELGGRLKMGVYEFLIAYSDISGNEISEYFSITNPISIFDENNTILEQSETAVETNFAIKLDIQGLDQDYKYYKIVVIQTADIEGATTYYEEGVHPINDTTVLYDGQANKKATTLNNLMRVNPVVKRWEGLTSSNNTIFGYGIQVEKEWNLQPIVNLIGSAFKWQSSIAPENFYEDGVNSSLYRGYNRDEVYPLGMRFTTNEGYKTAVFPLIGRPATEEDIEEIDEDNKDRESIESNLSDCGTTERTKRWQLYNTAEEEGSCQLDDEIPTNTIVEEEEKICFIEDIAEIGAETFTISLDQEFTGLEDYINENAEGCDSGDPFEGSTICAVINDTYPEHCTPIFTNCDTPVLVEEILQVQEIVNEQTTFVEKDFSAGEYVRLKRPNTCQMYEIDPSTGNPLGDPDFDELYQDYIVAGFSPQYDTSYIRIFDFINEMCVSAEELVTLDALGVIAQGFYHNKYGGETIPDLETTKDATAVDRVSSITFTGTSGSANVIINGVTYLASFFGSLVATANSFISTHEAAIEADTGGTLSLVGSSVVLTGSLNGDIESVEYNTGDLFGEIELSGFRDKLSKGALWFKSKANGRSRYLVEVTKENNHPSDEKMEAVEPSLMRLSLYSKCNSTSPMYTEIIDVSLGTQLFIEMTGGYTKDLYINENPVSVGTVTNDEFFISLDMPIIAVNSLVIPNVLGDEIIRYRTAPTEGCFGVADRDVEYTSVTVSYDSITFKKKETYQAECTYEVPIVQNCKAIPYKKGKFAYWESNETYPDNAELYNSSALEITTEDIPESFREYFEEIFTDGDSEGVYIWKEDEEEKPLVDFTCRNIRHFKFPDNQISPFIYDNNLAPFVTTPIFPLGVTVDEELVNSFLNIAQNNGLITQEQKESIVSYEILRGDATLDRSVLAKGYLFDMRSYNESNKKVLYANYPYNDQGEDKLFFADSSRSDYLQPEEDKSKFTFESPETDFFRPTLGSEMKVEGYVFGKSKGYFADVENHPKWVILNRRAKDFATKLAILEVTAEGLMRLAQMNNGAGNSFYTFAGISGVGVNIGGIISFAIGMTQTILANINHAIVDTGRYRYEWLKTFRDLGRPENFAHYYTSEGFYNNIKILQEEGESLRGLNTAKYLKPSRTIITNETIGDRVTINHLDREHTVFFDTGDYDLDYPVDYINYDNTDVDPNLSSRFIASAANACASGKSKEITRNVASAYVSMKNYLPSQFGSIGSVKWLTTGYKGDLLNPRTDCLSIYGGDTFISRYYKKRKIPLFYTDAVAASVADLTPFDYKKYSNIGTEPAYYIDYEFNTDASIEGLLFPDFDSTTVVDCAADRGMYRKPPSKFYLYYYGIAGVLTETRINTNYRYGGKEPENNFYPNVGDIVEWTQEKNVSIRKKESFFYNKTYSKNVTPTPYRVLPANYSQEEYNCRYDMPNGVMYSLPDNSENNFSDPWLIYRPYDKYEFPTSYGKLKDLRGIENQSVLARFEHTAAVFNSVDVTIDDGKTPETQNLGTGGIFARRPVTFTETELGYGGTQTTEMVSCEFGHFYVDAKRGQVIHIQSGGRGIEEISANGLRNWFKEQLPFKILKSGITGIEDLNIDNAYNGAGISMGWDSRFRRVFLTKKDYILNSQYEGQVSYVNGEFLLEDGIINLDDTTYFKEVSWTVAYSPVTKTWISYYDFFPNYYMSHQNYFQTGINKEGSNFGLWSHLLTNKSYQVFYGDLHTFSLEYVIKQSWDSRWLNTLGFNTQIRRYHNRFDYAEIVDKPISSIQVWGMNTNSGELRLVNNTGSINLISQYPKTASNGQSQEVLTTFKSDMWYTNYFYNRVSRLGTNNPQWFWDDNMVKKDINFGVIKFGGKSILEKMKGTYFNVLLKQDTESRMRYMVNMTWTKEQTETI